LIGAPFGFLLATIVILPVAIRSEDTACGNLFLLALPLS